MLSGHFTTPKQLYITTLKQTNEVNLIFIRALHNYHYVKKSFKVLRLYMRGTRVPFTRLGINFARPLSNKEPATAGVTMTRRQD